MKVKDLISHLSQLPSDINVVVKGYEGGVDDVVNVKVVKIKKDVNKEWYYGRHEIEEDGDTQVVYIQREERTSE